MANRVPLIINTTANQIQELAVGDCLDLTASGISNAGVITATKFVGDGSLLTNIGGGSAALQDLVDDITPQLGGNLDINGKILNGSGSIVITGGIQATSFTGSVVGDVTGNVSGSAGSASGLTGSPAIQVASIVATGHIQADTVSVASTLTYEDVTNIDSVGVVTARTGIKVLAGGINAVGVVTATSFNGSLAASNLTGALPAISGANLTNLPASGLTDIVSDTTPQLGGNLDLNTKDITGTGNIVITGSASLSGGATFGANGSITSGGNFTLNGNGFVVTGTQTAVGEFKGVSIPTIQVTQTTDNTDLQLRANATGGLVRTASNHPLVFGTNQVERMRVANDKVMTSVDFKPDAHHTRDIGTASNAFRDIYGQTITISTAYDSKGELRSLPRNEPSGAYTAATSDKGKFISAGSDVTFDNSATWNTGDAITIFNYNASSTIQIISGTGVLIHFTDGSTASTGNRVLAAKGVCTLLCVEGNNNTFVISGALT